MLLFAPSCFLLLSLLLNTGALTDSPLPRENVNSRIISRGRERLTLKNFGLRRHDRNNDGRIDAREFGVLCNTLFQDRNGQPYRLKPGMVNQIFQIFDRNSNGYLSSSEFQFCLDNWISKILNPVPVLVVVDVQNDFIDGSLSLREAPAGEEGRDVIIPINKMIETLPFRQVYYTKDWHPPDHISFFDNLRRWGLHESSPIRNIRNVQLYDQVVLRGAQGQPVEQRLWPRHCVWGTWGAELHPELRIKNGSREIVKGTNSDVDSYSAFRDNDKRKFTALKGYLDEIGATDVYVVGLAYDVCVGATSEDSLNLGYRTVIVEDATRGIYPDGIRRTREKILRMGGSIVRTEDVNDMLIGRDRRPETGLYLANTLKN